jgi:hypothetical protein
MKYVFIIIILANSLVYALDLVSPRSLSIRQVSELSSQIFKARLLNWKVSTSQELTIEVDQHEVIFGTNIKVLSHYLLKKIEANTENTMNVRIGSSMFRQLGTYYFFTKESSGNIELLRIEPFSKESITQVKTFLSQNAKQD